MAAFQTIQDGAIRMLVPLALFSQHTQLGRHVQ
jgi:hypothetical protein